MYGVYEFSEPFNDEKLYPAKAKLLEIVCGGTPKTKPDSFRKITPANWISTENPPFLLVQGDTDALISVNEAKVDSLTKDLNSIFKLIEQLNELDTDKVKPLTSILNQSLRSRKDEISDGKIREKILKNSPKENEEFFVVPKVVE